MTTMSVKTFINVAAKLPKQTSILLRGDHGIGKSQVVRQVGAQLGFKPEEIIDRRLSQMSEGDLIGLPYTDGKSTRFVPPDWFKEACDSPRLLFLDELNRATPEVMQGAFQIVLDLQLNGNALHPDSRVFSAINTNAVYTVNEVDPALLDRFFVVDLSPSKEEWLAWAAEKDADGQENVHFLVRDFITVEGDKWLFTPRDTEPGKVAPSPRSWDRMSKALVAAGIADQPESPLFYQMCLGFVGTEATIAFHAYAKNVDLRVTGEDILKNYAKAKVKIDRMGQEGKNAAIEKLAEHIVQSGMTKVTDKQGKNIEAFFADLPAELKLHAWAKLAAGGVDKMELIKSIHKHVVGHVLDVFGIKPGQAGVGMVPNLPQFVIDQQKAAQEK